MVSSIKVNVDISVQESLISVESIEESVVTDESVVNGKLNVVDGTVTPVVIS